ncbi:hypothetical protein [Micromonospora sp. NPDC049204]|uniref:hypothetical protein n=1 Tax=Micromonospora sp. NPDC049204 TaxID=3154351 RepID=UPI0033D61B71
MLYRTPALAFDDMRVLGELDTMRDNLRYQIAEPHRWTGQLRRTLIAHVIQGSNSIEGYQVSLDDAAVAGDEPVETNPQTWEVITGYRDAVTYVHQLARSREFAWQHMLLNALHFMMLRHDLSKWPGRWFCLCAHHQQVQLVRQRLDQAAHLWGCSTPGSAATDCPSGSSAPCTSRLPAVEYAAPSISATRTSPTIKQPETYEPSSGRTCSNSTARPAAGSTSPRRPCATSPPGAPCEGSHRLVPTVRRNPRNRESAPVSRVGLEILDEFLSLGAVSPWLPAERERDRHGGRAQTPSRRKGCPSL